MKVRLFVPKTILQKRYRTFSEQTSATVSNAHRFSSWYYALDFVQFCYFAYQFHGFRLCLHLQRFCWLFHFIKLHETFIAYVKASVTDNCNIGSYYFVFTKYTYPTEK